MGPDPDPHLLNTETDDWLPAYENTSYCRRDIAKHVPIAGSSWHCGRFWHEDKIIVPEDDAIRNAVIAAHHSGIL